MSAQWYFETGELNETEVTMLRRLVDLPDTESLPRTDLTGDENYTCTTLVYAGLAIRDDKGAGPEYMASDAGIALLTARDEGQSWAAASMAATAQLA